MKGKSCFERSEKKKIKREFNMYLISKFSNGITMAVHHSLKSQGSRGVRGRAREGHHKMRDGIRIGEEGDKSR